MSTLKLGIQIAISKSYYPEYLRKSIFRRLYDVFLPVLSFSGKINESYNLYGMDTYKYGNERKLSYLEDCFFWKTADAKNGLIEGNHNACVPGAQLYYLRDKYAFYHFMKAHGFRVPDTFCLLMYGRYLDHNMDEIPVCKLEQYHDFFIKDLDGQCASFVKRVMNFTDISNHREIISKGRYILQDAVHQSTMMNKINPNSINTLRIVTINKNGQPYVFSAILRIGTANTGNVDNWAAGGLAVGINDDGKLRRWGFYNPQYGTKVDRHPDTGFVFENESIEYFKEACDAACRAHKYFYGVHSIGWDIAITDEGPVFIEGNDNWGFSMMQVCNGGLKQKWLRAISE